MGERQKQLMNYLLGECARDPGEAIHRYVVADLLEETGSPAVVLIRALRDPHLSLYVWRWLSLQLSARAGRPLAADTPAEILADWVRDRGYDRLADTLGEWEG